MSVAAFVSKLRKAAETSNFGGNLDTSLRDRFLVGSDKEKVISRATKKGKRAIGAKRAEIRVRGKKFNKRQKRQNTSNLVLFRIYSPLF